MDRQGRPLGDLVNNRGVANHAKRWTAELASKSSASVASVASASSQSVAQASYSLASYLSEHSGVSPNITPYPGYDSTSYYVVSPTSTGSISQQLTPSPISYTYTTETEVPITLTTDSTTFITSTASIVTAVGVSNSYPTSSSSFSGASTATSPFQTQPVVASSVQGGTCAGNGIDNSAEGVVATAVIASAVGLIIWVRDRFIASPRIAGAHTPPQLIFAFVRPRLPQLYAVREWFLNPE